MDIQQKHSGSGWRLLPRLALMALVIPLVIWLDVMAILWWEQGILIDELHDFHNSLPAGVQMFLWFGLPLVAAVLGVISLGRGVAPKLSRWVISVGVILAVLALLAAMRPH